MVNWLAGNRASGTSAERTALATAVVDTTSLKAYWKFNEASGDILNASQSANSLGSGANIQITGATYGVTGHLGNALTFDGNNDYGIVGSSLTQFNFMWVADGVFTLAFWFRLNGTPTDTEYIFKNSALAGAGTGLTILTSTNNTFYVQVDAGGSTRIELNCGDNYVPDITTWHYYSITVDLSLSTNCIKVKRDNANLQQANRIGVGVTASAPTAMYIASRNDGGARFCDCSIQQFVLFNSILTSGELDTLWNGGTGVQMYSSNLFQNGLEFHETDTNKDYVYNTATSAWILVSG